MVAVVRGVMEPSYDGGSERILVAGGFGFFGLEASAAWMAQVLFFVFLVMAVVSFFSGRRRAAA